MTPTESDDRRGRPTMLTEHTGTDTARTAGWAEVGTSVDRVQVASHRHEPTGSVSPAMVARPELALIGGLDGTDLGPVDEEDWQERALFAQTDPEAFFPEKGGSAREAKRICQSCEVRQQCLEYALANDERFGIWGGLSERERRRLKKGLA